MTESKSRPVPKWAQPVHYVTATECGRAKREHRLSRNLEEVTCRFCLTAIRQKAEEARKGRGKPGAGAPGT